MTDLEQKLLSGQTFNLSIEKPREHENPRLFLESTLVANTIETFIVACVKIICQESACPSAPLLIGILV
jgi:hypothetical protein